MVDVIHELCTRHVTRYLQVYRILILNKCFANIAIFILLLNLLIIILLLKYGFVSYKLLKLVAEDEELRDINLDGFLLFLTRARTCRPAATIRMIKAMREYRLKTYPEMLRDVSGASVKDVLNSGIIRVVKRSHDVGPAVVVFRAGLWEPSSMSWDSMIVGGMLYCVEVAMRSVEVQRAGVLIVMDVGDFGFRHARHSSYGNVLKLTNCVIFASPIRVLGNVVINCPYVFEKLYQVVKFAIPERFRGYVTVTKNDFSAIHDKVSPELLPVSLGGVVVEEEGWETDIEKEILRNDYVAKYLNAIVTPNKQS